MATFLDSKKQKQEKNGLSRAKGARARECFNISSFFRRHHLYFLNTIKDAISVVFSILFRKCAKNAVGGSTPTPPSNISLPIGISIETADDV